LSTSGSPYFSDEYKHKLVDRFVSLYLDNALNIKIGLWDEKLKDYSPWKVDDRFLELKNLVYQYAGIAPATESVKKMAERQLYSMILLLKHEGRIVNEDALDIPVFRDAELEALRRRVDDLEKKLDMVIEEVRRISGAGETVAKKRRVSKSERPKKKVRK
jgi:hypothetical protein